MKRVLSVALCLTIVLLSLSGMGLSVSAASGDAPLVTVNVPPYATVSPHTTVTVSFAAQGGNTLTACDTRLEGASLGTGQSVSFTPSSRGMKDGAYTLIMQATDSAGNVTIQPLTFYVSGAVTDTAVASSVTLSAQVLPFEAGYAAATDGKPDLSVVKPYDAAAQYALQYSDDTTALTSTAGIPYQVFDVDLGGKTSGEIALYYEGFTKVGERIALKVYNPVTAAWDTLGVVTGDGALSATVNVASYNDGGVIHAAAVLDYETNGANTMIWSSDPQHYTKFEDLHEFYYQIYRYAAKEYQDGNAGYIITTGDLVDDLPTTSVAPKQWAVADQAMSYVEAVGMPNGLVSGNHDVGTVSQTDYTSGPAKVDYSKQLQYFPASRYNTERWFGGSLNNNTSHYDLITVGNVDFVVLYLGYGVEATDETIAWANDVLTTYRHRTAIVATHQYLGEKTTEHEGRGKLIFDTIVDPNPNVKVVLCGHNDGATRREKIASDGRVVHEILADYQFIEAEDRNFYANEHWIGSVEKCCGDGYIRLLSVAGNTLSSMAYSPVTGRYNPFGEHEMFSVSLGNTTPDRSLSTVRFAAAVVGGETNSTTVDRITRYNTNGAVTYSAVTYASVPTAPAKGDATAWPQTSYGAAATPSNPYYAHAAKTAPQTSFKVDVLEFIGLGTHPTFSSTANFGDNALNLTVDLNLTPYLYYSFAMPTDAQFTFAFVNNTTNAPWLTFMDATKGGTTMNEGAANWDAYAGVGSQYFKNSVTGCIDMRTLTKTADAASWEVEQLNVYNYSGKDVVFSYLFFGSEPINSIDTVYGAPATPARPAASHAAADAPVVDSKVDVLKAVSLNENAIIYEWINYGNNSLNLKVDLNKTPYLYYSFSQAANSRFTFALINGSSNAPWITFLDGARYGQMTAGVDAWNNAGGTQFYSTSMTGCIDMRTLVKDPTDMNWEVDQLNLYNQDKVPVTFHYLFFGSAATGGDELVPADNEALTSLVNKASATDTAAYTAASVTALNKALKMARYVDRADASAVSRAYTALANAMGGLTVPAVSEADASKLVSVKNYTIAPGKWVCGSTGAACTDSKSFMTVESVSGGIRMRQSAAATHTWPNIKYAGTTTSFDVQPYGGMYLKLDLTAQSAWAINLLVTQDGVQTNVRLNSGIVNSFFDRGGDNHAGTYVGVYDVSEAFRAFGVDPTATFRVEALTIIAVGGGSGWNTLKHLELFTGKTTSASKSSLQSLVNYANQHTKSLYTSASWTTMQSALSAANTTLSTSGLTQPAINLARHRLQTALDGLVLNKPLAPYGSFLPDDKGLWQPQSTATVTYDADGNPVVCNTNSSYAYADYMFPERYITVADHQLEVDMTVGAQANVLLMINGKWHSISPALTNNAIEGDVPAGIYRYQLPLSTVPVLKDAVAAYISGVRVYAVGGAQASAVTVRTLGIGDYCTHAFDPRLTDYGPAATPSNPVYAHAAKNPPVVGKKVDVLAACGLDHPFVDSQAAYGDQKMHLTVDLNETPYLYYSVAQADDSLFTFGFYNNSNTAPWFTFVDATKGAATMSTSMDIWNGYTAHEQYFKGSVSGCIDMRNLTTGDSWMLQQVTFYVSGSRNATVSYLFFGSEALADGYVEDSFLEGDINLDGDVTSTDVRETLRVVLENTADALLQVQQYAADLDHDGRLTTIDVRLLLKLLVS